MPVEENSTVPSPESGFSVSLLERGGKLIQSQGFVVQLGAYPETIKDTMTEGVPDLYLIPESLFDVQAGISAAELEFPLYYNYYLKRRKLRFICRPPQVRPLLRVLSEALFGPQVTHHHQEFLDSATLTWPPRWPGSRETPSCRGAGCTSMTACCRSSLTKRGRSRSTAP